MNYSLKMACRTGSRRRSKLVALAGLLFIAVIVASCSAKNTYAYLGFTDGTIEQYKVTTDGKFQPLNPSSVATQTDGRIIVKVDPSCRYAYAMSRAGNCVVRYKINADGTLSKVGVVKTGDYEPIDMVFSKSGEAAYVSAEGYGSTDSSLILQYRIASDGGLVPRQPASVRTKSASYYLAMHPSQPVLYATQHNGHIAQYRIKDNGCLKLVTDNPYVGDPIGAIAISPDGSKLYATCEWNQSIKQFRVGVDGKLSHAGEDSYGSEDTVLASGTSIAVDLSGNYILACYYNGASIACFKSKENELSISHGMTVTRDRMLRTWRELEEEAENSQQVKDARARKEPEDRLERVILSRLNASLSRPDAICTGPDGVFYVFTTGAVLRVRINSDGRMVSLEPAAAWRDTEDVYDEKKAAGASLSGLRYPASRGIVIFQR